MTWSRRAVLRGLGAAVALPALPSLARGEVAPPPVDRVLFWYLPVGMIPAHFTPTSTADGWAPPAPLAPLARLAPRLTWVTGLRSFDPELLPDVDPHEALCAGALTGDLVAEGRAEGPHGGRSVDQLLADRLTGTARFRSLELTSDGRFPCPPGALCAALEHVSWDDARTPRSRESSPLRLFERLFGDASSAGDAEAQALRLARRQSVLDFVKDATARTRARLGAEDRVRLSAWLDGVRDVERRLGTGEASAACAIDAGLVGAGALEDTVQASLAHVERMHELIALAFHCDQTRVATYMVANESSLRTFPELGISDNHHYLSHHGGDPAKIAACGAIATWHAERLAHLLDLLASLGEGDGSSLLDRTTVVALGCMGEPSAHSHLDLPVILAGGRYQTGRHVELRARPHADLHLTLLQRAGASDSAFGLEGSAPIAELP